MSTSSEVDIGAFDCNTSEPPSVRVSDGFEGIDARTRNATSD